VRLQLFCEGLLFDAQVSLDVLGQSVIDFCMAWYRLFLPGSGIEINVMAATSTKQNAAVAYQLADKF
jgi:hypothetical protein